MLGQADPASVTLAGNVGLACFTLSVEGGEFLLQALFDGLARVDGTADRGFSHGVHGRPPGVCRPSWKNQKPLQWVPVIFLARALKDEKSRSWYSKPSVSTFTSM